MLPRQFKYGFHLICLVAFLFFFACPTQGMYDPHHNYIKMPVSKKTLSVNIAEIVKEDIIEHEGFRSTPYMDVTGHAIGYGTHDFPEGTQSITREQAERYLERDIGRVIAGLDRNIKWWRDQSLTTRKALINMGYNMGISGLLKFKKALKYLELGMHTKAALEVLYSNGETQKTKTPYWKATGDRAYDVAMMISGGSVAAYV